ncbi:hypothetical protein PV325_006183 [Microctonus aethiopoides]|uniref:Uncharacterized protein n=1 Tax=Microctonus aethiopoides TaxID=144406 RepID=A0AA39CAE6_9HYME|nr:hypothetical protein PV325_006183 [Microctonus aethiopoides]KAK0160400.1 hypothetical protein PV328_007812 [Microctonus aethiopoides]
MEYAIRPIKNDLDYKSSIPCDLNPLCVVTVIKGMMLDYLNFYILGPLAALIDKIIKLSQWKWLSPNYISIFHVLVVLSRGEYVRLQPHVVSIEDSPTDLLIDSCIIQKKKERQRCISPTVLLISGTLVASSIAWNRYIAQINFE